MTKTTGIAISLLMLLNFFGNSLGASIVEMKTRDPSNEEKRPPNGAKRSSLRRKLTQLDFIVDFVSQSFGDSLVESLEQNLDNFVDSYDQSSDAMLINIRFAEDFTEGQATAYLESFDGINIRADAEAPPARSPPNSQSAQNDEAYELDFLCSMESGADSEAIEQAINGNASTESVYVMHRLNDIHVVFEEGQITASEAEQFLGNIPGINSCEHNSDVHILDTPLGG